MTISMAAGATKSVRNRQSKKIAWPYFWCGVKKSSSFTTCPANIEMAIPPMGKRRLVERSATKSKMLKRPAILTWEKTLKERAQKILPTKTKPPMSNTARCRPMPNFSIKWSTKGSANDSEEDRAAKKSKIKNNVPQNHPKGILAKTMGNDTNIKPGPWLGDRPFSKMRGKMAKPASSATKTSSTAIMSTDFATDVRLGR